MTEPTSTLRPGAPKLAFLVLAIAIYAASLCQNGSADLFWQLRTGHDMLVSGQVPRFDHYSWTRPGTPWVVHEWLSFALYTLGYRLFHGFAGVLLVQCAVVIVLFLVVFRILLRETGGAPLVALFLILGLSALLNPFIQPRPQLFTYLFVVVELSMIMTARRGMEIPRRLLLLIPIFILWSNLHAGVLVGLGLIVFFALVDGITAYLTTDEITRERHAQNCRWLSLTAVLTGLATLINPYGAHIYEDFLATVNNGAAMNTVSEWAAPSFQSEMGRSVELLLAVLLVGLITSKEERDPAEAPLILGLGISSIVALRNVPILGLVGTILMARHLTSCLRSLASSRQELATQSELEARADGSETSRVNRSNSLFGPNPSSLTVNVLAVAVIAVAIAYGAQTYKSAGKTDLTGLNRMASGAFLLPSCPEDGCQFMLNEHFPTSLHMVDLYGQGSYLIFRLPAYPVSIDGRADIYFGSVLNDSAAMNALPVNWASILDKYRPDFAVTCSTDTQARLYLSSPDWALVFASWPDLKTMDKEGIYQNTLIFVRRGDGLDSLIDRCRHDCPAFRNQSDWKQYRSYLALN